MEMHRFEYRLPRFATDFPITLRISADRGESIEARCTSVSCEGISANCSASLPIGSSLFLSLSHQEMFLVINTRVVYRDGNRYGLTFVFESEEERESVARAIDVLARTEP